MRSAFAFLALLLASAVQAQLGRKEVRTDTGLVVLHHFSTGQVSTTEWRDRDDRFGRSLAYDRAGRVIFSHGTRRIGGHASVHFSYHPNGAVSKAEVSDAPDAGIQWYRSTTTFNEAGDRTGFSEEGRDNYGPLHGPGRMVQQEHVPVEPTVPPKPEVVACQKMFVNEVFLVNGTKHAGKARVNALRPSPALMNSEHTLAPGDTVRLGTYSMGETFDLPKNHMTVAVQRVLRNRKKPAAQGVLRTDSVQVNTEHRRYYLVVRGWGK